MKQYNILCAFFHQTLKRIGSKEPDFFTFLTMSILITINIIVIKDFYTYFYLNETVGYDEYLMIIVLFSNGLYFYLYADYKNIIIGQKKYWIISLYIIFLFVLMIILLKLHHDKNV